MWSTCDGDSAVSHDHMVDHLGGNLALALDVLEPGALVHGWGPWHLGCAWPMWGFEILIPSTRV